MGQKCSCLFGREPENTYTFQHPEYNNDDQKNKIDVVVNDEFTRFANKKLFGIENSKATNKSLREDVMTVPVKESKKIIQIQKLLRGYLMRKQMKLFLHKELRQCQELLVEKIQNAFKKNKLENSEKDPPQFELEGWKEFYSDSPNEKVDGITFKNVLIVSYLRGNPMSIYTGEANVNNRKFGFGTLITKDGSKYIGHWREDKLEGWGRVVDSKGITSDGKYMMNILNGKGRRTVPNEWTYVGEFQNGKLHGEGKLEANDYTYEGHFINDIKDGKGTLTFNSGDVYEGEFKENQFNGTGQYKWIAGHTYTGEYSNGKFHGHGCYIWKDGGYYKGEYVNGIKEGLGTFKWSNGKIFKGSFKNGNPHGVGILIKPDGRETKAEFDNGKIIEKTKKRN